MLEYIKLFNNHSGYATFTQADEFVRANVIHCVTEDHVHYNPLSVFMFLSSDKKLIEIPYLDGMTSDVFQQYVPSHLFYGGYVTTPINSVDIEWKTMDEVDAMFGEITRGLLAKKSNELTPGMVYKVYTFPKSVYLNSAKIKIVTGNQTISITALTCMPSNLFRSGSVVIDDGDTPKKGSFAETFTTNINGSITTYTTSSVFGVEDAMFIAVIVTDAVGDGEHHTIKGSYTTYDNVTAITENPIWEGQL